MPILEFLDYAGVAVFAATGALSASRKQLDIIGYLFLASATGIGGGTIRDLVLGMTPVFWVVNPNFIIVCAAVAIAVFLTSHLLESRYRLLVWLDAMGLSAYCVMGAAKGLAATGSPIVALVTGTLTATFGGVLRDLLAGEPSVLLRPEIYVSAALIGASAFVLASMLGLPLAVASALGVLTAFAVRGGALRYGWMLPTGKAGPGRDPDDVM
ncbi:trimeric intracellular cation channel family protein [Sinorhizobium medicae]|uniref:Glycine transporter domain-containing protein n=1 Tax=Sinorhizobium medicae TaxID=110321 RepID=A0A508X4W4_9HYPH|nr:trimeric intracellular cation channel family protein [Sinorhizobium medicae]MDX0421916.1 trimeric intracellular cation channel family protein [Sinorhizobium medicae]MDX0519483.1 trimeric intracellular cation channel family protein [Sinorhizobium medicae]MDX0544282.1 trimeric intracellular cation channel family protein [Sinorhizobium medicae]MDX0632109.1 trimeric intracellular cation channel family protein [Sinorhizobium medicae]MDX0711650.1 trimeric intracellular cation channel family prote